MSERIKLVKLLEILHTCYDKYKDQPNAEYISVEFWHGEKELEFESVGQFSVVPDVAIYFKDESDNA